MKLPTLKFKRDNNPKIDSLRPAIFDISSRWYKILGLFFVALTLILLVGFKLFRTVYYETYKTEVSSENYNSLIGVNKLKDVVAKRENFIKQKVDLPPDPSL